MHINLWSLKMRIITSIYNMLNIIFALLTTLATLTLVITSPITIAITILIISICIALIIATFISSWIAFLLFLIYIGGMLIIFAYFVATSPNAPINYKIPLLISILTFISLFSILNINSTPYKSNHSLILNTFYSPNTFSTLIILALILLLTMVIVVKIVNLQKGPLRPFQNHYV